MKSYTALLLFISSWLFTISQQSQQSAAQYSIEKRFNVVPEPTKNGVILLRLKGLYGEKGADGIMGDKGPTGRPGPLGLMGARGSPGSCSVESCDSAPDIQSLLSRVQKLEALVKLRDLRDQSSGKPLPSSRSLMALHITSDILFSKGNISKNGVNQLPRNINLNIALKDNAKVDGKTGAAIVQPNTKKDGTFFVNSTVLFDPATSGNEVKRGITTPKLTEGEEKTERQFQSIQGAQKEVPSIKKSNIPQQVRPTR